MTDKNNEKIAYSVLNVQKFVDPADTDTDTDERIISGIASTPAADRSNDVVDSAGITYKNPLPLLWQHDHQQPVGHVEFEEATEEGIKFTAKIAEINTAGTLKNRVDDAWQSVKSGLVKGVSIGFRPLEYEILKNGGIHYKRIEVYELSLVTIPCNSDATITNIKEFDAKIDEKTEKSINRIVNIENENKKNIGNIAMSLSDQIKSFEDKLKQLNEKLDTVVAKSMSEARTLDDDEAKNYDETIAEIKSTKSHLDRLKEMESLSANRAQAVETKAETASVTAFGAQPKNTKNYEKGLGFAKFAKIMGASRGNLMQAENIAKNCDDERVYNAIAKAASMGSTTSQDYASLAEYQTLESEFVELLRPATIVGQISGFRDIPFNVKINGQSGQTSAGWVGEGEKKPTTSASFNQTEHGWRKLAGIVLMSDELIRDSSPAADRLIRDDLVRTIAQEVDSQFILPSRAATAAAPASVTNGVTAVNSSGSTSAALRADVRKLFSKMLTSNIAYTDAVIIMSDVQAMQLSLLVNNLGQPEFPEMQSENKRLFGVRVITSEAVGNNIVLAKPSEIYMSRGAVTIDSSNQATIEMSDGSTVNLYQQNSVAIRAEQYINWSRRRDAAVQYIKNANYDGTAPEAPAAGE